ncbi:MAG: hypothetical protein WD708_12765 [Kiritimatiellia bacterium]
MVVVICSKCGEKINNDVESCPFCGNTKIQKAESSTNEVNEGCVFIICASFILVGLLILINIVFSSDADSTQQTTVDSSLRPPAIGSQAIIDVTCLGSQNSSDFNTILDIMKRNDRGAVSNYIAQGRAVYIHPGTAVVVLDNTLLGRSKVRLSESSIEVWVHSTWLK